MNRIENMQCEYMENPELICTDHPRFSWAVVSDGRDIRVLRRKITVRDRETGAVVWHDEQEDAETVHIRYGGETLRENAAYEWQVRSFLSDGTEVESGRAYFETGIRDQKIWKGIWITKKDREDLKNCPVFRKTFSLREKPERAKLFISAQGLFTCSVNGIPKDEYVMAPGWTEYRDHLQYLSLDVTEELHAGTNVIGVRLGDGWFDGDISFNHQTHVYGDGISFAAVLITGYGNGTEEVRTDGTWKTRESGILCSSYYDGETWDLTRESANWAAEDFDDSSWEHAVPAPDPEGKLVGIRNEGSKRTDRLKPAAIRKTPDGSTLIDMGQNFSGWLKVTVNGQKGDRVQLKYGEILDKEGNLYTRNLRKAKQEDLFILRDGKNILEPHFTTHGFRFVKILAFPCRPETEMFEGIAVHTAMKPTMEFSCSDPLLNRLCQNILWGEKSNFNDVPTDCPQRDERLGWTGDAEIFARTASFLFGTDAFFSKWMEDVKAAQKKNGAVPFVVPDVLPKDWSFLTDAGLGADQSGAGWSDVVTIVPWTLYLQYGDREILQNSYAAMKKYIAYIKDGAGNGSSDPYLWDWGPQLGDWLALDRSDGSYRGATDEMFTSTAYYAYSVSIVRKTAEVLGFTEEADEYGSLFEGIVRSFHRKYMADGKIKIRTQTAQILPVYFGMLTAEETKTAADSLAELIRENGGHLSTGFMGTPYICHVLSRNGYQDLAYDLLLKQDYPSWLYQVKQGATTVWEHWDGKKPDGSFWSDNMNSFNHYAYGSIGEWMFRCMAGIDTEEKDPGFGRILLSPVTSIRLKSLQCVYHSVRGKIVSRWERNQNTVHYHFEIPANTSARITLEDGSVRETGSGVYDFTVTAV